MAPNESNLMEPSATAAARPPTVDCLRVVLGRFAGASAAVDIEGCVTSLDAVVRLRSSWMKDGKPGVVVGSVFLIPDAVGAPEPESLESPTVWNGAVLSLLDPGPLVHDEGLERPIEGTATPIRNSQDEIAGVVLALRYSAKGRHELSTTTAGADAESVIATLREPFVVLDKAMHVKSANRAFYRDFALVPEATENQLFFDLADGRWNIPALRKLLGDVLPHKSAFQDFEWERDLPGEGARVMLLSARRFEAPAREFILLAFEDITERRHAETILMHSETRYRRLFETAKDGILILDARTGRVADANPFMVGLLGYSHYEFMGKELWELGLFADISENQTAFRELQAKGFIRYAHLPLETRNGKQVEVEFVSNVYEVDRHKVIQCNIRDISERCRLERQTKAQAEALADLHRRKDEFLAMLSHELRSPLAPIFNSLHLLRLQGEENLIQHQARTVIERQVGQLSRLVDDLLEVSRISSGRLRLKCERLDLRGIVQRGVEAVNPLIERRRQVLSVQLGPEPMWVDADPARLEQVVANLLNNACKYADEGGSIWLTVRHEEDVLVLRVRDNGVGIDPELLPHIFDLFTQADRSLDRAQGGLGIGLALVDRLVKMHGGTVQAFSAGHGHGSEFVIRLPHSATAPEASHLPLAKAASADPTWRILVVDDNVDTAQSMALLLRMSGHEAHVAYSGPTGLEAALGLLPDVVLLDIGLPGLTGLEVARQLRQHPQLAHTWLVAISGYGREGDLKRSQEAGFDHHLVKPVSPLSLLQLLATLTSRKAGEPA